MLNVPGAMGGSLEEVIRALPSPDIDECETGVAQCPKHSTCVNLPGTYFCNCTEGFQPLGIPVERCAVSTRRFFMYTYRTFIVTVQGVIFFFMSAICWHLAITVKRKTSYVYPNSPLSQQRFGATSH
ncbi:unnamed protein product [Gongylonema pulchrum]|uniref:EGF-like domain-containing protein n=1 Tax=Gongylonema pulchrum TaxID=637853 RepID=A0A183D4C4_9BILA|nr:unnamed protein product [Gongylonema pulchrum]